jgi:hypothetical protein
VYTVEINIQSPKLAELMHTVVQSDNAQNYWYQLTVDLEQGKASQITTAKKLKILKELFRGSGYKVFLQIYVILVLCQLL